MASRNRQIASSISSFVDLEQGWAKVEKRLDQMTPEEKLQTLVDAGILTEKRNVRKPYRGVFRKVKSAAK